MKDYYAQIDKALKPYENGGYADKNMYWIADRIVWCWKFRKITEEQMDELTYRATYIFENNLCDFFGKKS